MRRPKENSPWAKPQIVARTDSMWKPVVSTGRHDDASGTEALQIGERSRTWGKARFYTVGDDAVLIVCENASRVFSRLTKHRFQHLLLLDSFDSGANGAAL